MCLPVISAQRLGEHGGLVMYDIVNFAPAGPLKPGTEYTLELPAGGIRDYNDNAMAEPFTMTFKTVGGE